MGRQALIAPLDGTGARSCTVMVRVKGVLVSE